MTIDDLPATIIHGSPAAYDLGCRSKGGRANHHHPTPTNVGPRSDKQISPATRREMLRERQDSFEHNRVSSINRIAAQLAELGLTPADIAYLTFSYMHHDHTGKDDRFAASTWFVRTKIHAAQSS